MLRVVIVDDEPLAVRAVRRLLAAHAEVEVVGTADSLEAAIDVVTAQHPDLVFLDIDLGAGTGFDLIARISPRPRIVFVTAHPQHAVEAFAVEAVDYLLKPILPERMAATLSRAARLLGAVAGPDAARAPIALRTPRRTLLTDPAEIVALRAEGDFTRVHLAGRPGLLLLRTLSRFEALLPEGRFLRVDRSAILNLDRVRGLHGRGRNLSQVALDGLDAPLTLGRTATARLKAALRGRTRRAGAER